MAKRSKKKPPARAKRPPAPAAQQPVVAVRDEATRKAQLSAKIFPRNLTAHAAYVVPGNPVVTRPEDTVANCFPGLEIDVRNLDRRFFPGLVFEYIADGARLAYVDVYRDPDLSLENPDSQRLYLQLADQDMLDKLATGVWYLDWIEQGGKRVSLHADGEPMPDVQVWRFVRSLALGPLTIGLLCRRPAPGTARADRKVTLKGWRRRYTDAETGVISAAYEPGELMQGLCSPWQHDFRDCACFYWAANHPDIVLGEIYPGESVATADGVAVDPISADVPLDWLRADRSRSLSAEALETIDKNRPHQLDHFQVNKAWQDLHVVVEGREIDSLYVPQSIDTANPFSSPEELATELRHRLGPLEIALTFEYLYARFSLLNEEEAKQHPSRLEMLPGAVLLARERLLLVAASEMQHLRWVNQLLWNLVQARLLKPEDWSPIMTAAKEIPTSSNIMPEVPRAPAEEARKAKPSERKATAEGAVGQFIQAERAADVPDAPVPRRPPPRFVGAGNLHRLDHVRPAQLRPLTAQVVNEFIAVEHPSAFIDGAYSRVVATLRQSQYPPHLVELAMRIAGDGVQHEQRFREIKNALSPFADNPVHLRPGFKEATRDQARDAAGPLKTIKQSLKDAYNLAADQQVGSSAEHIAKARGAMNMLLAAGEDLATRKGLGIPFFTLWNED